MTPRLQKLFDALAAFGPKERLNEVTIEVAASDYRTVCAKLRDDPQFAFEQLIDLCGVDYGAYADVPREGPRFAVVLHLLSV